MAKIVRYCKLEEEHMGDNCFDISRPNPLGNPYTHIKSKKTLATYVVKTREDAISLYDIYFDEMLKNSDIFVKEWDRLYNAYKTYDTIYLGCFCKKNEECHGDIIAKKLKQRMMKEMVEKIKLKRKSTEVP